MKVEIVLESYTGVNSFTFMLNTGGLNLYQASGSWFLAESKVSDSKIELGDIVAFDATGKANGITYVLVGDMMLADYPANSNTLVGKLLNLETAEEIAASILPSISTE